MLLTSQKKRKIVREVKSSVFELNTDDHEQFKHIFYAIEESPITQSLRVSKDVIKLTAEFATGSWKMCPSKFCGEIVSILQDDQNHCRYYCDQCLIEPMSYFCAFHCHGFCGFRICVECVVWCRGCDLSFCQRCERRCRECDLSFCQRCMIFGRCRSCAICYVGKHRIK